MSATVSFKIGPERLGRMVKIMYIFMRTSVPGVEIQL